MRADSKHISHILEKAPERREIYGRTFAYGRDVELRRTYRAGLLGLHSAPASFRDSANLSPCQARARVKSPVEGFYNGS